MEEPSYLDMLQSQLRQYRADRARAAETLADDDPDYLRKVLAGWDHAIGIVEAKIAREVSCTSS